MCLRVLEEEEVEHALASRKKLIGTRDVASVHSVSQYSKVFADKSWLAPTISVS